jgi:hypothetical protein
LAGYLINLDNEESLKYYIKNGIYGTKLSPPSGLWRDPQEGTLADYITMKHDDSLYFFIKRKIYGIGALVNIGKDCKFCNFPGASKPENYDYEVIRERLLLDEGDFSANQRWICCFQPSPHFFRNGIDMDEVLASNPSAFRMLRAFWKLSFIKFDDEENQAFKDIILKANKECLETSNENMFFPSSFSAKHNVIGGKISTSEGYAINIEDILSSCASRDVIRHEKALEAGLLYQLSINDKQSMEVFGSWDYLSHQVIASPFKPIDYMDKMDIFGYEYIFGYTPTRSRFLIIELKKEKAEAGDIEQLMKYVDWVREEYCFGDYSMINAFLVAHELPENLIDYANDVAVRKYTSGRRPARTREWKNVALIKYSFNESTHHIDVERID